MSLLCIIFLLYVSKTNSFTPNCVSENQFKFYSFPVEACSDYFEDRCRSDSSGYFKRLGEPWLVKIGETDIVPTCAFFNADSLKLIYGVNSKIKILANEAFVNLANLKAIHMAFNFLSELRKDVFRNVSVEMMDFSWNKIAFIDPKAFSDVRNLKHLNLSRNSLVTVPINTFPNSLTHLNLRHNLLTQVALNYDKYLNLSVVNLSNNLLTKIAMFSSYPLEQIDCRNNRLQDFDYVDLASVNLLLIGRNEFENKPRHVENLNAQEIDLYPNPWKCDQLRALWDTLVNFNSRLVSQDAEKKHPAECFGAGSGGVTETRSSQCLDDHDCASYMACRTNKCWDLCDNSLCDESSVCEAKDHRFKCSCKKNLFSDPIDIQGKCQRVECIVNAHCSDGLNCFEHKCIKLYIEDIRAEFLPQRPAISTISAVIKPEAGQADIARNPDNPPWWFEDIPKYL